MSHQEKNSKHSLFTKKRDRNSLQDKGDALFASSRKHNVEKNAWKTLIVDDEKDVHIATKLALDKFSCCNKSMRFFHAYSAKEALPILQKHSDIAIVLLDVVMETTHAGLELVKIIRQQMGNVFVQIILRTGQPGEAPEKEVMETYEINDYRAKTELTSNKLFSVVMSALRSYSYLKQIEDYRQNLEKKVEQRTKELNQTNQRLQKANTFIRKTFGRYLSKEIVNKILDSPQGLSLGGEKRMVTIVMTDLRGFSAIAENLPAEHVVDIINTYLETMIEIIFRYEGIIDEFIGDSILAIFGAPEKKENDAKRAVACALEMQLAMAEVNKRNQEASYPAVEMGIGINTGAVVVGNIGSHMRTKYGVVGAHVNATSRIESYTVGGQILISESTLQECGNDILRIDKTMEVNPKGAKKAMVLSEIGGISGEFNIFLPQKRIEFFAPSQILPVKFTIISDKDVSSISCSGKIVKIAATALQIQTNIDLSKLTDLKITLFDMQENIITTDLYAKITGILPHNIFQISFTSLPQEAEDFLQNLHDKV